MWKGKKGESDFVQIARKGIQGLYKSMSLKTKQNNNFDSQKLPSTQQEKELEN